MLIRYNNLQFKEYFCQKKPAIQDSFYTYNRYTLPMTYAYICVSTDKQDGNNQKQGIETLAKRKGLTIDRYIQNQGTG